MSKIFCWRRCYFLLALDCPTPVFHSILSNFCISDLTRFTWLEYIEPIVQRLPETKSQDSRYVVQWVVSPTPSYLIWLNKTTGKFEFGELAITSILPGCFRFSINYLVCTEENWLKAAERLINAAKRLNQLESQLLATGWMKNGLTWRNCQFRLVFDKTTFLAARITVQNLAQLTEFRATEVNLDELEEWHLMVINKQLGLI